VVHMPVAMGPAPLLMVVPVVVAVRMVMSMRMVMAMAVAVVVPTGAVSKEAVGVAQHQRHHHVEDDARRGHDEHDWEGAAGRGAQEGRCELVCCAVLCCAVLCCAVLCCAVLCAVVWCVVRGLC
jgi:hypothetical protein